MNNNENCLEKIKRVYEPAKVNSFAGAKRLDGFKQPLKYCLDKASAAKIGNDGLKADCLIVSDDASATAIITVIIEMGGRSKRVRKAKEQLEASLSRLCDTVEPNHETLSICLLMIGTKARSNSSEGRLARELINFGGKRLRVRQISSKTAPIWPIVSDPNNRFLI
ncbi:MAG: hypothetical protein ACON4I_11030 [Candidatus Puniceispirillaceae bacterium]